MNKLYLIITCLVITSQLSAQKQSTSTGSKQQAIHDSLSGSANLQIIRKIHERTGSIITAFREAGVASSDMEWWVSGPEDILPFSGTFKGLEGVADFQQKLNTTFRYDKVRIVEYIDGGNQIGVIFEGDGIARNTGRSFKSNILRLFTFVNGKVIKVRNFFDTDAYTRAYQGK